MANTVSVRMVQKTDTSTNWLQAILLVPHKGEIIVVSDYDLVLVGDGVSTAAEIVARAIENLPVKMNTIGALPSDASSVTDLINQKYEQSVIALSVVGTTVTYITGDGKSHTFQTQDTDTQYELGTDETSGLTKLYAVIGYAEDGTMTQKAITEELDKKLGIPTVKDSTLILNIKNN